MVKNKKKSDKGKTKNAILEALKQKPETMKELLKLGTRATIYNNITDLKKDKNIRKIIDVDGIEKYEFVDIEKLKEKLRTADSEVVELHLKYLREGSKKQKESAILILKNLSREQKIMSPRPIKALLELLKKTSDASLRMDLSIVVKWNLLHYQRDRNREDMQMIYVFKRGGISKLFIRIAEDKKENPKTREIALEILMVLGEENRYEIAFKILEHEIDDNNYKEMSNVVQSIIITQVKINKLEVRKRLYELLNNKNENVQKRALILLDRIGLIDSKPNNYYLSRV